ncbi:MAG: hypothetical protein EAY75_17375 [Bacteroidetes bacterium]|nr:MAG: hypothetical protein EAY75_17375 [Bacteroidota bacterium]
MDSSSQMGGTVGTGGSLARFTIAGNFLYTVDASKLTTYDISNPANPVITNTQNVGFEIETIFPFSDRLFIGSTSVIHIFSIANPAQPQKLSEAISPTVMRRCDPVVAKDTVAFATLRSNGECGGVVSVLAVFDIKNITKPVQTKAITMNTPYGLGYADTVLYVCDGGLQVFNIKNAHNPKLEKTLPSTDTFFDVIPYGNLLFCWTIKGANVYDITNRINPVKLAEVL